MAKNIVKIMVSVTAFALLATVLFAPAVASANATASYVTSQYQPFYGGSTEYLNTTSYVASNYGYNNYSTGYGNYNYNYTYPSYNYSYPYNYAYSYSAYYQPTWQSTTWDYYYPTTYYDYGYNNYNSNWNGGYYYGNTWNNDWYDRDYYRASYDESDYYRDWYNRYVNHSCSSGRYWDGNSCEKPSHGTIRNGRLDCDRGYVLDYYYNRCVRD